MYKILKKDKKKSEKLPPSNEGVAATKKAGSVKERKRPLTSLEVMLKERGLLPGEPCGGGRDMMDDSIDMLERKLGLHKGGNAKKRLDKELKDDGLDEFDSLGALDQLEAGDDDMEDDGEEGSDEDEELDGEDEEEEDEEVDDDEVDGYDDDEEGELGDAFDDGEEEDDEEVAPLPAAGKKRAAPAAPDAPATKRRRR